MCGATADPCRANVSACAEVAIVAGRVVLCVFKGAASIVWVADAYLTSHVKDGAIDDRAKALTIHTQVGFGAGIAIIADESVGCGLCDTCSGRGVTYAHIATTG